jgi:signal transduction histidine kinase
MLETLTNPIIQWLNDSAPYGIFVTDSNLVIRGWNNWLERHSARNAAELIGVHLFEAFPEIADRGLDLFYHEVLRGHTHVLAHRFHEYLIELPTDLHPGRMRQTVSIAPLQDNGVAGTITTIEDVTERAVTESELSKAREDAEKANCTKDRLLATLSHDLRTPLTATIGWTRIMQSRSLSADMMAKALKTIQCNTEVQLQLMDAILDKARIATGKMELTRAPLDMTQIIGNAVDALLPLAESKQIRLEKDLPSEQIICLLDAKRFYQIVWNLLSNGIKFTPAGGTVRTSLRVLPGGAELSFADTGMGIAPEDVARVFDGLWQSPDARGHGGLGLGLSITKQLVESHGGSIHAASAGAGKGATFTVTLPRAADLAK